MACKSHVSPNIQRKNNNSSEHKDMSKIIFSMRGQTKQHFLQMHRANKQSLFQACHSDQASFFKNAKHSLSLVADWLGIVPLFLRLWFSSSHDELADANSDLTNHFFMFPTLH